MPRTRLVWQLFAGFSVLLTAAIAAAFWVASLQLAGQADESLRQRLADAARSLAMLEADRDGPPDAAAFETHAQTVRTATRIDCRLIASSGTAATDDTLAEAAARAGIASRSRYDGASGRRSLEVAVPIGTRRPPVAIVLASADATESDRDLATWQRRLLAGCLGTAACAVAAGYVLARRVTRPIDELRAAAARLAGGDTTTAVPATEVAELADLATALSRLRAQLVERGLTIGRQGTQQEAVLGSMIEGVLAVDARQRLLGINRAAADLLDVDPDDSAGRPLIDVIRNPDLRRFALTAIDCRAPVEDDLVLHGPRDRTIRLRGTALRDASGEGGAVIVLNDVTEMKRLEHVRRDFVANVSHELKTPIASIKGFVETLLDGAMDDPADNSRFLGIVARQADRLAAIVDDLLALSQIEQREGAGNLPVENVPVASILTAVTLDCGPRAADRSIRLEVDCPANLAATLNAALVEQAVINLVDNALKYSESGKTVWLSAAASEPPGPRELVLCVRDEGCGIEPIHLPRLFERFYRVDKARSRNLGGTGLGLSIVKHIVQAHTGAVSVDSEPGVGTTFTIRLPRG